MSARGKAVRVPTVDGAGIDAELFVAAGAGPHPGVVVLHESFGLNDDIRRIAARFAAEGYTALAPDLYSHGRRIVCLTRVLADMVRERAGREIEDVHAAREALAQTDDVDPERIVVAGFCQGGGFALVAATRPGFRAAAVNYGVVPGDRSELDGVCPVVGSYGSRDRVAGANMARRLEKHLTALGVPHDVKTYEGVGHSFLSRVEGGFQGWLASLPSPMYVGYDEDAAEDTWRRMLGFFAEHVRGA